MIKTVITPLLACLMAINTCNGTSIIDYSYANDNIESWGTGKKEKYDIAMCVNDPSLAGKKILSIRALISGENAASDLSIWMSRELAVEKNVNVPDVMSSDALSVSTTTVNGVECAEIRYDFETPYELDESPVYIGYSLNVENNSSQEAKKPVVLSKAQNPAGLYVHLSKSCLTWKDYSEKLGSVANIYLTLEGDFVEYAAGVKSIPLAYAEVDKDFSLLTEVSNIGAVAINTIDYSYDFAGMQRSGHLDLEEALEPDMFNAQTVMFPIEGCDELGTYEISLTIDKINGEKNDNVSATGIGEVRVIPFMPVNRPLLEEYTGTWCGWCTRGWLGLEMVGEMFGDDVVCVAYHSGDPMEVTTVFPVSVSGFPSATLNRGGIIDPFYGSYMAEGVDFGISRNIDNIRKEMVIGDLNMKAVWSDSGKAVIEVTTDARFIYDLEDINYEIAYMIVENGLRNSDPSWNQKNYFSGKTEYAGSYLEELTEWPAVVTDLEFNDVAIDVRHMMGVTGSLASNVNAGETYTHSQSFDLSSNPLVQDRSKVWVVGVIVDKTTGKPVNANKVNVAADTAVETISASGIESTNYYDLQGRKVVDPSKGVYVKIIKKQDGSSEVAKVMMR